jgi:tRNA 2-selenouridine synthase
VPTSSRAVRLAAPAAAGSSAAAGLAASAHGAPPVADPPAPGLAALVRLAAPPPPGGLVVLAGPAGAGKTDLLGALARTGEQTLDLEALARHRGSAFGGLGQAPQPSRRTFARAVRAALDAADPRRALWVEDEGPFIGRVAVPRELVVRIGAAPVVEVHAPLEARVARLIATYGAAGAEALVAAVERSFTRVGPPAVAAATAAIRAGDLAAAARVLLPAYDAAYGHRAARLDRTVLGAVDAWP